MSPAEPTAGFPTLLSHLPSPAYCAGYGQQQPSRHQLPPLNLKRLQDPSLASEATLRTGGLRTPPAELNMSTAYHSHNPVLSSTYDSHVSLARQPSALAQASRSGSVLCDAAVNHMSRSHPLQPQVPQQHQQYPHHPHPQQQQQPQYQTQAQPGSSLVPTSSHPRSGASKSSTRPSTPSSTATSHSQHEGTVSKSSSTMVTHSLQLPSCISPNGGNLDDFAALVSLAALCFS
jgi:hypothetical protein